MRAEIYGHGPRTAFWSLQTLPQGQNPDPQGIRGLSLLRRGAPWDAVFFSAAKLRKHSEYPGFVHTNARSLLLKGCVCAFSSWLLRAEVRYMPVLSANAHRVTQNWPEETGASASPKQRPRRSRGCGSTSLGVDFRRPDRSFLRDSDLHLRKLGGSPAIQSCRRGKLVRPLWFT